MKKRIILTIILMLLSIIILSSMSMDIVGLSKKGKIPLFSKDGFIINMYNDGEASLQKVRKQNSKILKNELSKEDYSLLFKGKEKDNFYHLSLLQPSMSIILLQIFKSEKYKNVKIVSSLRSFSEQEEIYGMGREVTQARAKESFHNYGLAIDILRDRNHIYNLEKDFIILMKNKGFEWGGDWGKYTGGWVDEPHFQYKQNQLGNLKKICEKDKVVDTCNKKVNLAFEENTLPSLS